MTIARADLEALLGDLVRIDARNPWLIPGGPGEGAIAGHIVARLRPLGIDVTVEEVAQGRPNVIARVRGTGGGRSVVLNAHIDTVGDASWPDRAMKPVIEGDRMIGLGAADDKGHAALMVLLMERFARSGRTLRGDVVAAFVMDEEATSDGSFHYVAHHSADACIILEPFGLGQAVVSHQGFGWLDITVTGRAAHGSAPEMGIDAISGVAAVIGRLDALGVTWAAAPHPQNGATVYHASTISGGSDYATYPASVTLGIEIGTQPGETILDRVADIEAIFADITAGRPDFRAEVTVKLHRDPFLAVGHEALREAVAAATLEVTGNPLVDVGENAWMDAAIMQAAGIPTISLGATGANLHAADEWVSLRELVMVGDIVERAIGDFCA